MIPVTRVGLLSLRRTYRSLASSSFIRGLHTDNERLTPVFQVWGSNTAVGKTVFSAALLHAIDLPSLYLKPVQSGYPQDDDAAIVKNNTTRVQPITLFTFSDPTSPDLAAQKEGGKSISDDLIVSKTSHVLNEYLKKTIEPQSSSQSIAIIETAGGVLSPAPSGALQADVYRPLRLPSILVGDSSLGGISATLAAYEALCIRGYEVPAVVLFADPTATLENEISIDRHIDKATTTVFLAPSLPPSEVPIADYLQNNETKDFFRNLHDHLRWGELYRLSALNSMADEASKIFWYPFTQHANLGDVLCFDSAHGDTLTTYDADMGTTRIMTDAIGSWWTNGVGHGNVALAKAIGHAAGRYGHVMFAEAANKPTLELSKRLLAGPGAKWASRVFFSDNGSTAMEVALKMAMRKRSVDCPQHANLPVKIVGLKNSYHGDTLGTMDCSEDSDFNKLQTPWYEPRGVFFDPPLVSLRNGTWTVQLPDWIETDAELTMKSRDEVFSTDRSTMWYGEEIGKRLDDVLQKGDVDLGALVIEPILLGAGGMHMIDPVFQRALVEQCRERKIPIVFDEIFTGLWRLGEVSGADMLQCQPDIAAFGKLLTGGTVPIAVTLASEEILRAFDGSSKREALLHGHSYTAHAIGCAAGVESLRQYDQTFARWKGQRSYWCENYAKEMSTFENVERVTVIGTVLAVEMKSGQSGYAATGSSEVVAKLKEKGIFARPLGNVVYLMVTPITEQNVCHRMTLDLMNILDHMSDKTSDMQG